MAMNLLRKLGGGRTGSLIWGGLAVLMVIGLILCSSAQSNEIDAQRAAAEQSAVHRVRTALFENLDPVELSKPILGPSFRDLLIVVQAEFMADPAIGRVRIWQPDGTLIFSTQERDLSVTADVQTRDMIEDAIQGRTSSVQSEELVAPGDEIQPVRAQMLKTITPIRVRDRVAVLGAAEVDTFNEHIEQAATSPWRTLRIVLGLVLLVSIVMAFVAVRWPRISLPWTRRHTQAGAQAGGARHTAGVLPRTISGRVSREPVRPRSRAAPRDPRRPRSSHTASRSTA